MPKGSSHIRFHYQRPISIPRKADLKAVVAQIGRNFGKASFELNYIFCTDEYLLEINEEFLKHEDFTDIITFNLGEGPKNVLGEIYISVDRVRENAAIFRTRFHEELARVVFHGAFHLSGLKDKSKRDQKELRAAEEKYLRVYKKRVFYVKQKRKTSFT